MNIKQELENIEDQLENLYKEKTLFRAIDVFEKVKILNLKLGIESSQITAFNEEGDPCLMLTAEKDGEEIENTFIGLIFKKHGIEPVSSFCFIDALAVKQRCTIITIKNTTTLDDFMNKYIGSEYNSRYLYKKMLPGFDNDKTENKKKPKI